MSLYKIKISCTTKDEFSFYNKKINQKTYKKMDTILQVNAICYINSIGILYKKNKDCQVTTKTLEFIFNKELNETEFLDFINKLKACNFKSKIDTKIRLINIITNEVKFCYKYNSCIFIKDKIKKHKKNNSNYFLNNE